MEADNLKKTHQEQKSESSSHHPYFVQVIERYTEKIIQEVKCQSISGADNIQSGLEFHLDPDKYYTKLIVLKH